MNPARRSAPSRIVRLPVVMVAAPLTAVAVCGAVTSPASAAGTVSARLTSAARSAPAVGAAPTAPAAPRAGRGPGLRTASPAGTTVPGAPNCPMFPANNVWNTDISRLPTDAHSAAWLRSMNSARTFLHPDFGPNPGGFPYGIPYNIVTSAHPLVSITFRYASQSDKGPYPFGSGTLIEGGKNAGGDRHAIMVNSGRCTLYELWHARYSRSGSTAGSGAIWTLTSNRLRPAGWTSADAAGLPILPGLLNFAQSRRRSGRAGRSPMRSGSPRSAPGLPTCGPPAMRRGRATVHPCRPWAPGSG